MPFITISETGGLGPVELELPADRLSLTPGSRICLEGIGRNRDLLRGTGIDWGSGSGCLAIVAVRIPAVDRVIGIEVDEEDVVLANRNAAHNGVSESVVVVQADLFSATSVEDERLLDSLAGASDFFIANPPASLGDDGLGWRRAALDGARRFLVPGAPALVQVSYQYGERIPMLAEDVPGYTYEGVAATTDWVPFDLAREDLLVNVEDYAAEEARGGYPYTFRSVAGESLTASQALVRAEASGESPLSRWQMHLFRWGG
jgi:SAM-dependent methyltransferase